MDGPHEQEQEIIVIVANHSNIVSVTILIYILTTFIVKNKER